jgi:hypothetical protein
MSDEPRRSAAVSKTDGWLAPRASRDRLGELETRLAALEDNVRALAGLGALDGADGAAGVVTELPSPERGLRFPAAWRARNDEQFMHGWKDLARWVDWLIDAYRLPPKPWSGWWRTPGACEELAALRAWHRELCDHLLADSALPDQPWDVESLIDWHREEKRVRLERARGLVEWHEALWPIVARLAGDDQKPLLARETEATPLTVERRDVEAIARGAEFDRWLSDDLRCAARPRGHRPQSLARQRAR